MARGRGSNKAGGGGRGGGRGRGGRGGSGGGTGGIKKGGIKGSKHDVFDLGQDMEGDDQFTGMGDLRKFEDVEVYNDDADVRQNPDFEDEEIPDDEAFNEEDEVLYGSLFSKTGTAKAGGGGGKKGKKQVVADSDDDDGEYAMKNGGEADDGDMIDLSDLLNSNDGVVLEESSLAAAMKKKKPKKSLALAPPAAPEEEDDDEEEEDEQAPGVKSKKKKKLKKKRKSAAAVAAAAEQEEAEEEGDGDGDDDDAEEREYANAAAEEADAKGKLSKLKDIFKKAGGGRGGDDVDSEGSYSVSLDDEDDFDDDEDEDDDDDDDEGGVGGGSGERKRQAVVDSASNLFGFGAGTTAGKGKGAGGMGGNKRHKVRDVATIPHVSEGEFAVSAAQSGGSAPGPKHADGTRIVTGGGAAGKLSLRDLVGSLQATGATNSSDLGALKSQMERLESSEEAKGSGTLPTPLSRVELDRINRKAGFEAASKDLSLWTQAIQKNRQAETLNFPLDAPQIARPSNASLTQGMVPQTDMEQAVADILRDSGVGDETAIHRYEELAMNRMDPEEARRKHAELAKMRHLMFYEEMRAKRAKKIKSRAYRKLKKKERAALELQEEEGLSAFEAKERLRKQQGNRARERMTLAHKNKSKWVQRQLDRGIDKLDAGTRQAIGDQLGRHEELKKKQRSLGADESSEEEDSVGPGRDSDSDSDEEGAGGKIPVGPHHKDADAKAGRGGTNADKLFRLTNAVDKPEFPDKGLFGLKFMQKGIEKRRLEAEALLADLNDDGDDDVGIGGKGDDEHDDDNWGAPAPRRRKRGGSDGEEGGEGSDGSDDEELEIDPKTGQLLEVSMSGGQSIKLTGNISGTTKAGRAKAAAAAAAAAAKASADSDSDDSDDAMEFESRDKAAASIRRLNAASGKGRGGAAPAAKDADASTAAAFFGEGGGGGSSNGGWVQGGEVSESRHLAGTGKKNKRDKIITGSDAAATTQEALATAAALGKKKKKRKGGKCGGVMGDDEDEGGGGDDGFDTKKIQLDVDDVMGVVSNGKKGGQNKKAKTDGSAAAAAAGEEDESGAQPGAAGLRAALAELDRAEHGDQDDADADDWMSSKPSKAQQSLLNDAFGGQDGGGLNEDEFEQAKNAAVEADMPQLDDALKGRTAALPGWGGWSDQANPFSGFQKKLMKNAKSKVEQQRRALVGQRTDSRLKNVIINEKVDKRFSSKYSITAGDVPFPFTSREQYERSMRQPLGREWNTAGSHSKLVAPKVTTKGGVIIQPLKNGKMSSQKGKSK